MIVANTPTVPPQWPAPQQHDDFLALPPVVERYARVAFRGLPPVHREEAVAEAVAAAFESFVRLKARGKDPVRDFPSAMATFGVLHVKDGRHVGGRSSVRDVLSAKAQRWHGFTVQSLDEPDAGAGDPWQDAVADNTQTPVPDQASFRLAFPKFLRDLSPRDRRLACFLALGYSPRRAAARFGLTPSRVTQLRVEWCRRWHALHGEEAPFERRAGRAAQAV